ncbi:MAG: 30S ribosomal protein S10 [Verrucomicrobia bacterium]|nr:MAG: 30S ribosomal protein S10 [Verrucomicrobiota bacterium]
MSKREKQRIRIKLRGFDPRGVDGAAFDIVETAKRSGAIVSGPVPLPTKIEKFSVNSSPFINKKTMDQWETRTHERVVDIIDPTADTVEHLRKLNLPAGVEITITL